MPTIITRGAGSAVGFGLFGTVAAATDPYFNYNTLLLPGNGTNGGQNNTFLDSSTNNFTITRNGNTTQGTFSPFSVGAGYWSNYFDGSSYFTYADNAAFEFGSGDLTIEAWIFAPGTNSSDARIVNKWDGTGFTFFFQSSTLVRFVSTGASVSIQGSISVGVWTHVAVTRSGSSWNLWINGVSAASTTASGTIPDNTTDLGIGGTSFNAVTYLSNVRLVKGTAVYTSTFTPPTTPLTAISGTSLLICQDYRFKDASSNGFTPTISGTPSVQAFSPFAPTAAYSASTVGGSGYFDGSGDYLTVPDNATFNFGSNDFTIEMWVYPTAVGQANLTLLYAKPNGSGYSGIIVGQAVSGYGAVLYASSSGTSWDLASGASIGTMIPNAWNHIVVSRSGTNIRGFLNGTVESTTAVSTTALVSTTGTVSIGSSNGTASTYATGYISGLRVLNGTGYTSITIPTSPPTAITNTSLLLNFTNAAIIDNTAKNDLETVGNAQISTAQSKFGGGSISTGATSGSNCLTAAASPLFQMMTGNFTIEGWFLPDSGTTGTERTFYIQGVNTTGGLALFVGTGGARFRANGQTDLVYSGTISSSVFTHIAFVRNGNTRLIFVNGTQVASDTLSFNNNDLTTVDIGAPAKNAQDVYRYYGYIDDLRITKGIARYTSNFTPPTAAFPLQ